MLRMAHTGRAYQSAVERVRSLAHQMNGLLIACTSMYVVTLMSGRDVADDSQRLLTYLAVAAGALVLLFCIPSAERRVAYITEAFVIGMIRGKWPTDDTA